MAAVTWEELIEKLEKLWRLFELWDGLPSPPENEVPSVALDAECDAWLANLDALSPDGNPGSALAPWLRLRAVAAWALAQSRAKMGMTPPRQAIDKVLQHYLVTEWNEGGLREWRFRASLPEPE